MPEHAGKCPLCGGVKSAGNTTFTADMNASVVVVREVPALVCEQCGEAWIQDAVAAKLEAIVNDARNKHTLVEVAQWQDVA
ncbi:MAG: YgiT-type zinc finger protein [Candidatus Hydrogenedens sp.]|nr:YgiT-type zinc finger protein [Candidatus Hydrogenedens sp.]